MRKLFWALIIVVIILTVIMAATGLIARYRTTVATPDQTGDSTADSSIAAEVMTAPVIIQNFAFNPPSIKITKGAAVVWMNNDSTNHDVDFDDGRKTGTLQPGQSGGIKFDAIGTFNYRCSIHPWMKGQIIVK